LCRNRTPDFDRAIVQRNSLAGFITSIERPAIRSLLIGAMNVKIKRIAFRIDREFLSPIIGEWNGNRCLTRLQRDRDGRYGIFGSAVGLENSDHALLGGRMSKWAKNEKQNRQKLFHLNSPGYLVMFYLEEDNSTRYIFKES
jgi:hypothetical protein